MVVGLANYDTHYYKNLKHNNRYFNLNIETEAEIEHIYNTYLFPARSSGIRTVNQIFYEAIKLQS